MNKTSQRVERGTGAEMHLRSRRGFLIAGAAAVAAGGFWQWLNDRPEIDGLSSPFRKMLEFNGRVARRLFRERALAPEFDQSKAVPSFRRNGDIGLSEIRPEEDAKGAAVRMKPMEMLEDTPQGIPGLLLTLADVRKLPHVELVTEFKCIEGWSEIAHWGGARLRDFLAAFPQRAGSGNQLHPTDLATGIPKYVGFETPDGQYYVGIEREVALHLQTLLAYELNGQPLTPDHGAPLRLVTPLKYGIKQLEQIGRMTYTDLQPHDYWHEQGYDYYAGL